MIEHVLVRVPLDSPERCQGSKKNQQCPFKKAPGSEYCYACGGNKAEENQNKQAVRNYRLSQWQGRVNEFADNEAVKSLREEIGILRLTLESIIDSCNGDQHKLIMYSGRISDMVTKIEKVVCSAHKLECASGEMIDKTRALQLGAKIVEIISAHVKDGVTIDIISSEILMAIAGPKEEGAA